MVKAKKLGTFGGVFTPSILTILGVIMYMRMPMIAGETGLFGTLGDHYRCTSYLCNHRIKCIFNCDRQKGKRRRNLLHYIKKSWPTDRRHSGISIVCRIIIQRESLPYWFCRKFSQLLGSPG